MASLAVRTGIPPSALLAESDQMLSTMYDVIREADEEAERNSKG